MAALGAGWRPSLRISRLDLSARGSNHAGKKMGFPLKRQPMGRGETLMKTAVHFCQLIDKAILRHGNDFSWVVLPALITYR
jgi:hypothetical protein